MGVDVGTIEGVGDGVAKALETRSMMASEVAVALGGAVGAGVLSGS